MAVFADVLLVNSAGAFIVLISCELCFNAVICYMFAFLVDVDLSSI